VRDPTTKGHECTAGKQTFQHNFPEWLGPPQAPILYIRAIYVAFEQKMRFCVKPLQ
jgi:hypothetical protein